MNTRALVACTVSLGLGAALLVAQEKPADPQKPKAVESKPADGRGPRQVEEIVEVKNRDLIPALHEMVRAGYGVRSFHSGELGVLVVGGPPESVAAAVAAIRRFDVPRTSRKAIDRNAEITGYLLLARHEGNPSNTPLPPAIVPVVTQLKEHLAYKHYDVAETLSLRVRHDGSGEVSGILPSLTPGVSTRSFYRLGLHSIDITGGTGEAGGSAVISIGRVQLNVEVALPEKAEAPKEAFHYKSLEIKTGIDMREGQKAVVGKTTLDGTSGSLILVLTAKVVE